MKHNCGNCKEGRKRGFSMTYCQFYGIDIRNDYDRCARHKPRIVEVEREADERTVRADVRREGTGA